MSCNGDVCAMTSKSNWVGCRVGSASICLAALVSVVPAAAGDTIPRWDIAAICSASSLGPKCPAIESQNRKAVFQRWEALAEADRKSCEQSVVATGQLSYRSLLVCLEDRQLRAIEMTPHSGSTPAPHDS